MVWLHINFVLILPVEEKVRIVERQSRLPIDSLVKGLLIVVGLYAAKELAFGAAKSRVRKEVRERAGGICETCGKSAPPGYSVVSHFDHNENSRDYNNADKLTHNCKRCEAVLHLTHFHHPKNLGLKKWENANTAYSNIYQLTSEDYFWITKHYGEQIEELLSYLEPKEQIEHSW